MLGWWGKHVRKKLYDNKYVLSGTPDEMVKKMSNLGRILSKVDVETMEVAIVTKGYQHRELLSWFTQRRLTVIGIAIGVASIALALLVGLS